MTNNGGYSERENMCQHLFSCFGSIAFLGVVIDIASNRFPSERERERVPTTARYPTPCTLPSVGAGGVESNSLDQ